MANDFMFKRSMTVGSGTAESDGEFLDQCFVRTPEFETLLDYSDRKMILLGRTGSGKTALLKMVKKNVDYFINIKPDTFALQYISNIPFIQELSTLGINLEIFYKFLWLHEIMSKVIKEYFAYNRKNFIDQFAQHMVNPYRIGQMKKYFEEYGDVFFEERSAENITQQLESKIFANIGDSKRLSMGGELSESQKKEIQTRASTCVNTTQIAQLKNIIELLKEYLSENKQKRIFVAIDDLDTNWIADKTKYMLISALLSAIRLFLDVPGFKIVLAMRADVFRKTCLETNRQNEKDEAFTLKLNWSEKMLWEVLGARIRYLFSHKYQKHYQVQVSDIFVKEVRGTATEQYLVERTMMRPRDLITLVNMCIEDAESQSVISSEAICSAERKFQHDRHEALVAEWKEVYPTAPVLIALLYEFKNEFSLEDLKAAYSQIESMILSVTDENDPLVRKFLTGKRQDEFAVDRNLKALLDAWYIMGLIGRQDDMNLSFATPDHPSLDQLDFIKAEWFEVHPLFRH